MCAAAKNLVSVVSPMSWFDGGGSRAKRRMVANDEGQTMTFRATNRQMRNFSGEDARSLLASGDKKSAKTLLAS